MTEPLTVEQMCRKFSKELREWWSFNNMQEHTHSWHTREDFIDKALPKMIDDLRAQRNLKPLEWRTFDNAYWSADCLGGNSYEVYRSVDEPHGFKWLDSDCKVHPCDSIDHGKRLCQFDFEKRVAGLFE